MQCHGIYLEFPRSINISPEVLLKHVRRLGSISCGTQIKFEKALKQITLTLLQQGNEITLSDKEFKTRRSFRLYFRLMTAALYQVTFS